MNNINIRYYVDESEILRDFMLSRENIVLSTIEHHLLLPAFPQWIPNFVYLKVARWSNSNEFVSFCRNREKDVTFALVPCIILATVFTKMKPRVFYFQLTGNISQVGYSKPRQRKTCFGTCDLDPLQFKAFSTHEIFLCNWTFYLLLVPQVLSFWASFSLLWKEIRTSLFYSCCNSFVSAFYGNN